MQVDPEMGVEVLPELTGSADILSFAGFRETADWGNFPFKMNDDILKIYFFRRLAQGVTATRTTCCFENAERSQRADYLFKITW